MKHFKLLLAAALVLALGALTSCGGDDNKATNKLVIKGVTYTIDRAMYMLADKPSPNGMPYHLDIDVKGGDPHGYGEVVYPGEKVELSQANCPVYLGFNFNNGGYYGPEFKSGTLVISEAGDGDIIVNIDAIDQNDEKFVLSAVFHSEESYLEK